MRDLILITLVTASALTDLSQRKIFNFVTLPGMAAGLALAAFQHQAGASALGLLAGLGPGYLLWRSRIGLGGGDVKLLAAVGALAGPRFVYCTWIVTFVLAMLAVIVVAAYRRLLWQTLRGLLCAALLPLSRALAPWARVPTMVGPRQPLGIYVAAAVLGQLALGVGR